MSLIHDSEREDFVQCIVTAGLSVDDFELTEQRDESGPKEQRAPRARLFDSRDRVRGAFLASTQVTAAAAPSTHLLRAGYDCPS